MAAAPSEIRDVILRSGGTLRLRPPREADVDALVEFFRGLSQRSVYQRFHGFPTLAPATVEPFVDPDWDESGALMGTLSEDGDSRAKGSGPGCSSSSPNRPRRRESPPLSRR